MEQTKQELESRYLAARPMEFTDSRTACEYLPDYAAYETAYGTKQYYEDIYQKLKGIPQEKRDCWYLLALMRTKENLFEAMFEYQDGIRTLFKEEFVRLNLIYDQLAPEEKMVFLAAEALACKNNVLLPYKYVLLLVDRYQAIDLDQLVSDDGKALWEAVGKWMEVR